MSFRIDVNERMIGRDKINTYIDRKLNSISCKFTIKIGINMQILFFVILPRI